MYVGKRFVFVGNSLHKRFIWTFVICYDTIPDVLGDYGQSVDEVVYQKFTNVHKTKAQRIQRIDQYVDSCSKFEHIQHLVCPHQNILGQRVDKVLEFRQHAGKRWLTQSQCK